MLRQKVQLWAESVLKKTWVSSQLTDYTQGLRLKSLLASVFGTSASETPVCIGQDDPVFLTQTLPLGSHFIYHNPISHLLSGDGYFNYQAPMENNIELFKRRMWTGGQIIFNENLPINSMVECTEKITSIKFLNNQCFVTIERTFNNVLKDCVPYLVEKRHLMYTNENYSMEKFNNLKSKFITNSDLTTQINSTENFRFSALTYNAHKIHYDQQYCISEGLPGPIVSGPFLITLILNFFALKYPTHIIKNVTYKVKSPVFENINLHFVCAETSNSNYNIKLYANNIISIDASIQVI